LFQFRGELLAIFVQENSSEGHVGLQIDARREVPDLRQGRLTEFLSATVKLMSSK
jgi:hypothetical protein